MDYRSSDRHLDEQIVSGLIAVQFPDLAALTWLADAADDGPAAIAKHLSWVASAFSR